MIYKNHSKQSDVSAAVMRWKRDNRIQIENARKNSKRYRRKRLPNSIEAAVSELTRRCSECGCAPNSESLTKLIHYLQLTEEQIAKLPAAVEHFMFCAAQSEKQSENAVRALCDTIHMFETLDQRILFEAGALHHALLHDPAGTYPHMHPRSQAEYRAELAHLAKLHGISELEAASLVLELANAGTGREKNVGYWILERPLGQKTRHRIQTANVILGLTIGTVLTVIACIYAGFFGTVALPAFFMFGLTFSDMIFMRHMRRRPLPRMNTPESSALCVIVSLITNEAQIETLACKLEDYALSAGNANLCYGILADFRESTVPNRQEDEQLRVILLHAIDVLNEKYGSRFFLFTRERTFSENDRVWRGWERKRGAILQLCTLMMNQPSEIRVQGTSQAVLYSIPYLIILDEDTRPGIGSLDEMIAAADHPLNQPVVSADGRRIEHGYGILNPNLTVVPSAAAKTDFARIHAGCSGFDRYAASASELRFDLFGTTAFTGKGLIHVSTFLSLLKDTLPESSILSHDLPEGEYLRTGFCAAAQFADGFPETRNAFERRRHRWIRGDIQNLRLLGKPGTVRIISNVLAAFYPIADLETALAAAWLDVRFLIPFAVSLFTPLFPELLRIPAMIRSRVWRTFVPKSDGPMVALRHCLDKLLYLPETVSVTIDAAVRAFVRMVFTRRGLLEWTTAADASGSAPSAHLGFILTIAVFGLSRTPVGIALAALWTVVFFLELSFQIVSRETSACQGENVSRETHLLSETTLCDLTEAERGKLLTWMSESVSYFMKYCTTERNGLPPDNVQYQSSETIAERTSPTNVGLALLSIYAGMEQGLIECDEAWIRIERIISALERWPKWEGHPYNWINIRNMNPLHPIWVSTVDSGNLAISLVALRQDDLPSDLRNRISKLLDDMNFTALYDGSLKLFYLGRDIELGCFSESHYDLADSESRSASYWGIASGQIPSEHWNALRRPMRCSSGFSGLASWSGTAFETMMPFLFLPCPDGAIWQEAVRYHLYVQRKAGENGMWGMSESGFFAFDEDLNYQYKAHGTDAAAVQENRQERVFAPYAAFLFLPFAKTAVFDSLCAFEKHEMHGEHGFYEAYDAERGGKIVRSYMAHHVGMTVLSIWRALNGGAVRLLTRDPHIRAFLPLQEERIPNYPSVLSTARDRYSAKELTKPYERVYTDFDTAHPRLNILGNPAYRVLVTDIGQSMSICGNIIVTGLNFEEGFCFQLDERPLFPCESGGKYNCKFCPDKIIHESQYGDVSVQIETRAAAESRAEQRLVRIRNTSGHKFTHKLQVGFTPILAPAEDASAHPVFSALFLRTKVSDNTVEVCREARGRLGEVCCCFMASHPARFSASREAIPRGELFPKEISSDETDGYMLDTRITAEMKFDLKPGEVKEIRLSLGCGHTGNAARKAAQAGLILGASDAACRIRNTGDTLGMSAQDIEDSMELYAAAVFGYTVPDRRIEDLYRCQIGRNVFWKYGISGDLPVIVCEVKKLRRETLYRLLRAHVFLFVNALPVDLLLLCPDGGRYDQPLYGTARDCLDALDSMNLIGIRGGVHFSDPKAISSQEYTATIAHADILIDSDKDAFVDIIRLPRLPKSYKTNLPATGVLNTQWGNGEFSFTGQPPVGWSHVLCNRIFGYLAADTGNGFCWYFNSRENKINAWENKPFAVRGPESLMWMVDDSEFSAFQENGSGRVTYGCGYAIWERTRGKNFFRTTAFVHPYRPARIFIMETDAVKSEVRYMTKLQMGADPNKSRSIITNQRGTTLCARSTDNTDFAPYLTVLCSSPAPSAFTCDADAASSGNLDGFTGVGKHPCFAVRISVKNGLTVIVLGAASDEQGIDALENLCRPETAFRELDKTRHFWNNLTDGGEFQRASAEQRRYLEHFALYQVISCRLWGRTSLWQNGGAFGFRDQLQDVISLLEAPPNEARYHMARAQILRCAARQYSEGDVQHWWHPRRNGIPRGVRTHISDDLLFLPWVLTLYCEKVNDNICDIRLPYLHSKPLASDEHDRYEEAEYGTVRESVYDHCIRALELVPQRGIGIHGLLHMGSGDWNDGMDEVHGESVWLTLFASAVYRDFSKLCAKRGDSYHAARYHDYALALRLAAERSFTGTHYVRAFFADGHPMGENGACEVDAIAQSFAAVAGCDSEQVRAALKTAAKRLIDREHRLVRLFDPPFTQDTPENPGYIKAYPPGVRENGGQYTHGAVWLAWGFYLAGMREEGDLVMRLLCPTDRPDSYCAEPYALCADVYSSPAPAGKGGWSLYTGAASWYYSIARRYLTESSHEDGDAVIK